MSDFCTRFSQCTVRFSIMMSHMIFAVKTFACAVSEVLLSLYVNIFFKTVINKRNYYLICDFLFSLKEVGMKSITRNGIYALTFENSLQ